MNIPIKLSNSKLKRYQDLYESYKKFHTDPKNAEPKIIINTPSEYNPPWEERLENPEVMMNAHLSSLKDHIEIGDDRVLTTRVDFGTAQIAFAFGCDSYIPPNNLPCAKNHILTDIENVHNLKKPSLDAGWYNKLHEYTNFYKKHLPEGIHIQHPDIQSTFNSSHLIRGNDILFDFYDCPDLLEILLDLVTDYMIDLTKMLKSEISDDKEWFFDWGAMWKGSARISNCSTHLISPEMYEDFIMKRDFRFLEAIGGGRIHYCGTYEKVIDMFFNNPYASGLDFDSQYHDFYTLCKNARDNFGLIFEIGNIESKSYIDLINGKIPEKKNIVLIGNAKNVEEGKHMYNALSNVLKV